MSLTRHFYAHESDSMIILKKDKAEVRDWTNDLEYINEELEYLLDMEELMFNNSELHQRLHTLRRENTLRLGNLYRHENSIRNYLECDTTDCDTYYLNHHEKHRNTYREHLEKYRFLKSTIFRLIVKRFKK